jgi:hypothetical protein
MAIEEQDIRLDLKAFQEQKTKRNLVGAQDGVRDVDAMYQFKNMTYIYAGNVSEKLQLP